MYSLSFTGFFKQYRINNNYWLPPGIEPRITCITHKRSATELRQPADKQTLDFCIHNIKGYCYATVSFSTDQQKFSFFKDSYYSLNFTLLIYHLTFSISAFSYSLDVISHNNICNSILFKKACERDIRYTSGPDGDQIYFNSVLTIVHLTSG